jgi:hypothetical protein
MNVKQAKEYYDLGIISTLHIVRDPMSTGWLLVVETNQVGKSFTLQTALNKDKVFSSLDTVHGEIEHITGRVSSYQVTV